MTIVARADQLAKALHQGQTRKSTGGSYFQEHLIKVAEIVKNAGGSDEAISAAFLHDSLEDCPEKDPEQLIREQIGDVVLGLVQECTEIGPGGEDKAPWIDRKRAYLEHISMISSGALLISVADKLQSARDDLQPYVESQGDRFYDIFKKAGATTQERKANTLWFHRSLVEAFDKRYHTLVQTTQDPSLENIWKLIIEFEAIVRWLEKK